MHQFKPCAQGLSSSYFRGTRLGKHETGRNIVENFSLFINSLTSTGHVICDLKLKHLFIWK